MASSASALRHKQEQVDGLLMGLASQHGSIKDLLHSVFGFLHRRTDFYVVDPAPSRPVGFDTGVAEQLVMQAFRSFPLKPIPVGNGGVCPKYWWTQTLYEVTVYVDVPAGTRGRDIACTIRADSMTLGLKSTPDDALISGDLDQKVKAGDSMWSIESNRTVVITLEKQVHTWWACVVKGDPEIDTQKVDSTMRVEEYDPETQSTIRKIMFDQQQQARGLPTSDELRAAELLEKAKGAPGSPFG